MQSCPTKINYQLSLPPLNTDVATEMDVKYQPLHHFVSKP
jgi:hypothetical protein